MTNEDAKMDISCIIDDMEILSRKKKKKIVRGERLGWPEFQYELKHPLQAVVGMAHYKTENKLSLSANSMRSNLCHQEE